MSDVIDLNACVRVPFSTFQRAASTLPFESFYELHLFLIANFTSRIRRGAITCGLACLCVDGRGCVGYVLYCVSLLVPDVITVLPGTNVLLHWN